MPNPSRNDADARDILVSLRKEIEAFTLLKKDLSSHVHACTSQATKTKVEKLSYKVDELSNIATILNEKVSEHCEFNGIPIDNITLDELNVSDQQHTDVVRNVVSALPVKKPPKKIPSIRQLSVEDLQSVPSYMKGRLTTKTINDFIEKLNIVIQTKYTIIKKAKKLLTGKEKQYAIKFKDQETNLTKGSYFCIAEDLKVFCSYNFVNTTWSIITILRHCKLIREIREPKLPVKYAVVEEN